MIHVAFGKQGSGKTLYLVAKAYEMYLKGVPIYSNVHLNFPYNKIRYEDIINCKYSHCMVLIDEIHLLLPSRGSGSNPVSRKICDGFLSQIRKKGVELYGTSQTPRKIDVRIRDEMDYVYFAERWTIIEGVWQIVPHPYPLPKNQACIINLDVKDQITGKWLSTPFLANSFYDMYDTEQVVIIEGLEEAIEDSKKKKPKMKRLLKKNGGDK